MITKQAPPFSSFLAPRFWPTWLGIGFLFIIAYLPLRLRLGIGSALGKLTWALATERRYITSVNIQLCFPELSDQEQNKLVFDSFRQYGIGLIETATGWVRDAGDFDQQLILTGREHMDAALAKGKGVLLLGAHYSTLDFCANLLSYRYPFGVTYRAHKNPLFDAFMLRGRLRNCNGVFDRNDIRGTFRHLKKGLIVWYAPDQDYGPEHSVYAPFFNNNAATITAAVRFAAFNQSPVILVRHHRIDARQEYEIEFIPLPDSFPAGDDVQDCTLINEYIEKAIRFNPAQYLWMHKRFKTQPGGKPESPYINIKTSNKNLGAEQYKTLTKGAVRIANIHSSQDLYILNSGLYLREFAGTPSGLRKKRHLAMQLDSNSKALRSAGFPTITPDNIFRFKFRNKTGVTYFVPEGVSYSEACTQHSEEQVIMKLAEFLTTLHNAGFSFTNFRIEDFIFSQDTVVITDPLRINIRPFSVCYLERLDNIRKLLNCLDATNVMRKQFCKTYRSASQLEQASSFINALSRIG